MSDEATEPATEQPPERPDDEEEGEDDLADAGYAQIGFNSGAESEEEDDNDDDDAEAPERTGHSEELETGALDDRVRAGDDASAAAQPEAAAQGWVQFDEAEAAPPPPGGAATATPIVLRGAMDTELPSPQEPPRAAASTTTAATAPTVAAPPGENWTQGGFEGGFEDDDWADAAESFVAASSGGCGSKGGGVPAPQAGAAWEADFEEPVTCDTPPLPEEQVELIKQAMAALDIAPPPWVRRMQQLQKVQQMQAALQQTMPAEAAADGDGGVPAAAAAAAAPQFRPDEAWVQQMQQHAGVMPGARLLSTATIAAASPFAPADGGVPGSGAPTSLSGVPVGPKRVSAKQLAAERRKEREERKKRAAADGR